MPYTSKLTPEQWAEARRLRAEGAPFDDLAARYGLRKDTIARRARRECWPSLEPPARTAAPRARFRSTALAPPSAAAAAIVCRSLKPRLMNIMDIQAKLTELRMQQQLNNALEGCLEGKPVPGTVEEGDKVFRHVATASKTIEQVTEIDPERASPIRRGALSTTAASASEADAFRREIAERIEKLIPPS